MHAHGYIYIHQDHFDIQSQSPRSISISKRACVYVCILPLISPQLWPSLLLCIQDSKFSFAYGYLAGENIILYGDFLGKVDRKNAMRAAGCLIHVRGTNRACFVSMLDKHENVII